VLRLVFLLGIMVTTIIFTPFAFGQELQKSTWLESASVIYDDKFSNSVQASITFETINNNEIQFSNELLEKIMSYEEVRFVFFTNLKECVMGVDIDDQCIMIGLNMNLLMGDLGINAIHENGTKIANELITDINNAFDTDAKFHSIYLHMDDGNPTPISNDLSTTKIASAVFTLPREENSVIFSKLSEQLINEQLRQSGGFYDVAKELAKDPNAVFTVGVINQEVTPMMMFKTSVVYEEYLDGISVIAPLEFLGTEKLERSKHFENHFVPLNSVVQVIVVPESPSQINTVNTNIIKKLDSAEDLSENGWFFVSKSYDRIDARYLFGQANSVTGNELVMEIGSANMQNGSDSFSIENINIRNTDVTAEQYAILAAIVIAAIGAAIFYLKGYKRNR